MGKGLGFGKTIFFGEHFVVYEGPVIAGALSLRAEAKVIQTDSGGWVIEDSRQESPGYKEGKKQMQLESLQRIFKHLNLYPKNFKIVLGGNLPAFSGIGATGASSVAIVRAISDEFRLKLTDDEINRTSYQAEIAYHGPKTVGIDNMIATYGGVISLTKGKGETGTIKKINLKKPFEIVIGNTEIAANTKVMLDGVAERKTMWSEKYNQAIEEAKKIGMEAQEALEAFDLYKVGALMNQNHTLLQTIEVSCPELDLLVDIARQNGALGAKMTGSGGGGCMLALTPGKVLQEKVARAIEQKDFQALRTTVSSG